MNHHSPLQPSVTPTALTTSSFPTTTSTKPPLPFTLEAVLLATKQHHTRLKHVLEASFQNVESLQRHFPDLIDLANHLNNPKHQHPADAEYNALIAFLTNESLLDLHEHNEVSVHEVTVEIERFCIALFRKTTYPAILLSDLYALFNRARGTLFAPNAFFDACRLLNELSERIGFASYNGVNFVHDSFLKLKDFEDAILKKVQVDKFVDVMEISSSFAIQYPIVRAIVLQLEKDGTLCRDETDKGVVFYENLFLVYHRHHF